MEAVAASETLVPIWKVAVIFLPMFWRKTSQIKNNLVEPQNVRIQTAFWHGTPDSRNHVTNTLKIRSIAVTV
jgi:hypothetical protein